MCLPHASASKATRRPRLAALSPSSCRSAAARSMPPTETGDTLLQIMRRSQPSSCMTSNFRSARAKARSRCLSGMPSKSRNGCRVTMSRPSCSVARRTSAGVPLNVTRSFSKISTAWNCAAAIASSFSLRLPLRDTVAIEVCIGSRLLLGSNLLRGLSVSQRGCLGKRAVQATKVGSLTREEPEALGCLVHAHAGPAHHLASFGAGGLDQLGLERRVDDIGHPMPCLDTIEREGNARYPQHSDRRRVDHACRTGERCPDIFLELAAALTEVRNERAGEAPSTDGILIVDEQYVDAQIEQREGDRATCAPC